MKTHAQIDANGEKGAAKPGRLLCGFFAALLVTTIFADVVFGGGSLSPMDYERVIASNEPETASVSLLPEPAGRPVYDGWGDIGAAVYQMQPAQKFMAFAFRSGESPYWDPYTATGMPGPETVADLKFSFVTVVTALLGARSSHFTFLLLGLYICSVYAVFRLITHQLGLSVAAAVAASAVFLLNGFALTNLNNAIAQAYFLGPILLVSLAALSERAGVVNIAMCVAAHAIVFSVTFFPTMVLIAIAAHCVALALGLSRVRSKQGRIVLLACQAAIPLAAVCLLAFFYLPIIETFLKYVDTWKTYDSRIVNPIGAINLLSGFTPKHFGESYHAMQIEPGWQGAFEAWVPHFGILAALAAAHAVTRKGAFTMVGLVSFALVLVAEGKVFGLFPFTLLGFVPFFKFIRNEYWPAMSAFALVVMAGLGFDGLRRKSAMNVAAAATMMTIAGAFCFLYARLGLPASVEGKTHVAICAAVILSGFGGVVFLRRTRSERLESTVRYCFVFAMVAEGLFYMNTRHPIRSSRDQNLPHTVAWLKDRIANGGGHRVLTLGSAGVYPNWSSALQIPELGTLNAGGSPRYNEFYYRYIGSGLFLSLRDPGHVPSFTDDSLSLVGVKYVIADKLLTQAIARMRSLGYPVVQEDALRLVFENPNPLPRAFAVPTLLAFNGLPHEIPMSPLLAATTTDAKLLYLARQLQVSVIARPSSDPAGSVLVQSYHHDSITLSASLQRPAIVVVTDSWHPNWTATVDGKPTYVGWVNVAFRGIPVSAGEHTIELSYTPKTKRFGQMLSSATLLTLLVSIGARRKIDAAIS
jgi:hypothetical protein